MSNPLKKLTVEQLKTKLSVAQNQKINHPFQHGRDGWAKIECTVKEELEKRGAL